MADIIKITGTKLEVVPTVTAENLYSAAGFLQVSFPFSNDKGLGDRFDHLQQVAHDESYSAHDAAIIVGSGGVTSLAPVLPPNIWLTDYSSKLLSWMDQQVTTITQNVAGRHDYTDWLQDEHRLVVPLLGREIDNFEFRHFTESDDRFAMAQSALGEATIGLVDIDYSDPAAVATFAQLLRDRGQEVRVMNLTNMHHHATFDPDLDTAATKLTTLTENLAMLPAGEDLHAVVSGKGLAPLPVAHSLDDLADIIRADMALML